MLRNKLEQIRLTLSAQQGKIITQKEFAKYLDVGYSLYNRWANQHGNPNRESLLKLSKKLNCKIEDLVEDISD